ncbi:MAG: glycosyltransferase [Steroidobacteraceae bacterium]
MNPEMPLPDPSVSMPTLSIIIPSLEPDLELRRCINSVWLAFGLDKSDRIEVIVVTPGKHVEATAGQNAGVRVISESHPSIYGAMNDGALAAKGKYLLFLGKDDILLPYAAEALLLLENEKPDALFCDVYFGKSGIYSGLPSRLRLLVRNLCHQGIIYSRATFALHGPYVRRMKVQADHLLNIKVLWHKPGHKIAYLAFPLVWYSNAGFSLYQRDKVFWRLYPLIIRKYVGLTAAGVLSLYRALRFK